MDNQFLEFLNYGVLGVVVLGFLFGWIVPKPTHDREVARGDKAEIERDKLILVMQEKVIPALMDSTRTLEEARKGFEK